MPIPDKMTDTLKYSLHYLLSINKIKMKSSSSYSSYLINNLSNLGILKHNHISLSYSAENPINAT
jgi:hypothetical protein